MKKSRLVLILAGLLISVLVLAFRAPSIPHPIEGKQKCVTCHAAKAIKPFPAWHEKRGYTNDDCSDCHSMKSGME